MITTCLIGVVVLAASSGLVVLTLAGARESALTAPLIVMSAIAEAATVEGRLLRIDPLKGFKGWKFAREG
jgi:hypothetical protein